MYSKYKQTFITVYSIHRNKFSLYLMFDNSIFSELCGEGLEKAEVLKVKITVAFTTFAIYNAHATKFRKRKRKKQKNLKNFYTVYSIQYWKFTPTFRNDL